MIYIYISILHYIEFHMNWIYDICCKIRFASLLSISEHPRRVQLPAVSGPQQLMLRPETGLLEQGGEPNSLVDG